MSKKYLYVLLIFLSVFLCAERTVTLQWDANTETDLAGYRLYYGTTARPVDLEHPAYATPEGFYDVIVPIADPSAITTSVIIPTEHEDWYFALIAYDTGYLVSNFSNEVKLDAVPEDVHNPGPAVIQMGMGTSSIMLQWEYPPEEIGPDGYMFYASDTPGVYTKGTPVATIAPSNTIYTYTTTDTGIKYFVVTALWTNTSCVIIHEIETCSNSESDYSNEVNYTFQ